MKNVYVGNAVEGRERTQPQGGRVYKALGKTLEVYVRLYDQVWGLF